MTARVQKRLAIAGGLALLGTFIAANAHFINAAFRSQPACVAVPDAAAPAKRAC